MANYGQIQNLKVSMEMSIVLECSKTKNEAQKQTPPRVYIIKNIQEA